MSRMQGQYCVALALLGLGCAPAQEQVVLSHGCGPCSEPTNRALLFRSDEYPDFSSSRAQSQGERRLYGYVRSRSDSTAAAGAQVYVRGTQAADLTDAQGRYNLFVPDTAQGEIQVDLVGYRTELIPMPSGTKSARVDVQLGMCPICLRP